VGSAVYNKGLIQGILTTEAILTAQKKFGNRPIIGEEMQYGLENLNITKERIKELGAEGLMPPVKTSCRNHEGFDVMLVQQWDGNKWVQASAWIEPFRDLVRAEIEKSAAKYAKEKGITPRKCE
jgi:branched-chain amino acid transport system substrate-binding protein